MELETEIISLSIKLDNRGGQEREDLQHCQDPRDDSGNVQALREPECHCSLRERVQRKRKHVSTINGNVWSEQQKA